MGGSRYAKERKIRVKYRRVGRRFTYIQRKTYDFSTIDNRVTSSESRIESETEEDRLAKGLSERSIYFTRRRVTSGRIASMRRYRTRGPGIFRNELRKRQISILRGNTVRRIGSWKWYESDVDVTRTDRGRSRRFLVILFGRRYTTYKNERKETHEESAIPRNLRKRRRWRSVVGSTRRIEDRRDRSNRRSRRRLRRGYRRCFERSRLRRYRRKGRKIE